MQDLYDEPALRRMQRQLHHEVEHSIREANREIIHAEIPTLDKGVFVGLATVVARLRANYLSEAIRLTEPRLTAEPSAELVSSLRAHREAYKEACEAFEALQRAIERGYVDIEGLVA